MTPLPAQRTRVDRTLERLYRRHAADVFRYALAVLHNQADAEDVTQTTFLNAYRALDRGERPRTPHNWLIAIAHNVCRQRFRQSARRPSEVAWDDDIADRFVEDEPGPGGEDIRRALGHLAFNQRSALVMRELEGRSYAEIGEVLGVSTSAVETLIFRARRALREQLESGITCGEAEIAISKQLDGRLSRAEKGALRAHLRECPECATFARRQRAQRAALRSIGAVPLPASLASLFGGTGSGVGIAVAAKATAVVAAAAFAGSAAYESVRHAPRAHVPRPHATIVQTATTPSRTLVATTEAQQLPLVPKPRVVEERAVQPSRRQPRNDERGHAERARTRAASKPRPVVAAAHARGRAAHGSPAAEPAIRSHANRSTGHGRAHGRVTATPRQTAHPYHPSHPLHPSHLSHSTHPTHPSHVAGKAGASGASVPAAQGSASSTHGNGRAQGGLSVSPTAAAPAGTVPAVTTVPSETVPVATPQDVDDGLHGKHGR